MTIRLFACLALAACPALLVGCETFTPPVTTVNVRGKTDSITSNANRRGVYFVWVDRDADPHWPASSATSKADGRFYMVSEPPPDTALASTVSLLAKLSADVKTQSGSGEGKLDVAQTVVQIARATSVSLLRDTLFRLSEAYANGAINSTQYEELHREVVVAVTDLANAEASRAKSAAEEATAKAKEAEAIAETKRLERRE